MPHATNSDSALRRFVETIVTPDASDKALRLLAAAPALATARFRSGATRQSSKRFFLAEVSRYIYTGDTALHFAAAAYRADLVRALLHHGANPHATNRLGDQPIHAAAVGSPGSPQWNPAAQSATIRALIDAGADPNATDNRGITPLHRAVRTRCSAAVRTLLDLGADPSRRNKSGSTPLSLATQTTGRPGSGSAAAKSEQQEILRLLHS